MQEIFRFTQINACFESGRFIETMASEKISESNFDDHVTFLWKYGVTSSRFTFDEMQSWIVVKVSSSVGTDVKYQWTSTT